MASIAGIIKILFILFILFSLVKVIITVIQEQTDYDTRCKGSVRQYHVFRVHEQNIGDFKINCPTRKLTLSGDEDLLKKQVADEMYRCWDNYGRGELNLFPEKDKKFCAYCSHINFENNDLVLYDFMKYLTEEKTPKGDMTYYQFLTDVQPNSKIKEEVSQVVNDDFYTGKEYAVLYTHYTEGIMSKFKKKILESDENLIVVASITGVLLLPYAIPLGFNVAYLAIGVSDSSLAALGGEFISKDNQRWDATVELVDIDHLDMLECEYMPVRTEE